jgi:alanyl-tRNA synthetase
MKTASQIRQEFFSFFQSKGHTLVDSAPVVPENDPTLLFTNAGMNQFKDVFLGRGERPYKRAVDTQKCIRVSGKHNDLEVVGRDTYHHTFFEMLGNWSFGDYYKAEAIRWAWELLTNKWQLPKERLYATVYKTDEEALALWQEETDIDPGHILRFGDKDNFWEMGETGPCGPCSEIHFDLGEDVFERLGIPPVEGGVNSDSPRFIEIWNLVFIQYYRNEKGELEDLPQKHVDTGMGFERIVSVLQGQVSNYDTDLFAYIISGIASICGLDRQQQEQETEVALRVIADHVRALSFAIADGAMPGNEGRGYVLRRILRRAARYSRILGQDEPVLYRFVQLVVDTMADVFPELQQRRQHIETTIRAEEEQFNRTLDKGLQLFHRQLQN